MIPTLERRPIVSRGGMDGACTTAFVEEQHKIGIVLFPNANADALEKGKLCKY